VFFDPLEFSNLLKAWLSSSDQLYGRKLFQTTIVSIPNCQSKGPYNTCGIPLFAPYYFLTFVVITTLSLLNILVAIMIYFFDAPDDVNMNYTPYSACCVAIEKQVTCHGYVNALP
jgi:hypothetical protein